MINTLWNIRSILLLPPLLVTVLATVISVATLFQLKLQFDSARQTQAEYMQRVIEAERLSEQTLAVHQQVRHSMEGAVSGLMDELRLYYIHSDVVNDLASLQQQVGGFANSPQMRDVEQTEISAYTREFEAYRRFMIMATDIIAIDPTSASHYISLAHDHFVNFTHVSHRISVQLLEQIEQAQQREMALLEGSYYRILLFGLLGMVLVYFLVSLVAKRTSQCLLLIADALKRLGKQDEAPPELPEITRLQQRAKGEIKQIADSLGEFRQALLDRHRQQARINELSYFDPLTGLANRRLLLEHLHHALREIAMHPQHCALLFIDLDNFKNINDTLGHSAGDILLKQAAERIIECLSSNDTAARAGGDEFIILLENLNPSSHEAAGQIQQTAESLLKALNRPYTINEMEYMLSASIGVTLTDNEQESPDQLMLNADLALYQAKAAGKNTLRFFDPRMQETVNRRAQLESDLREALAREQFMLFYQPQINRDGELIGYEALIRWQHPEKGMVSPAEFIPLAEETGLIIEIGYWVMKTACQQLVAWQTEAQKSHYNISINVSSVQFAQHDFAMQVSSALVETGANPRLLKLELTESLLLDNVDDTIDKMNAINRMGIHFSLDDFGTGYSSLSYLKHLPLSWLKIDQSFVRDMMEDEEDDAIVRTIIALGKSLGLRVIAEGVETSEQHQHLIELGCDEFQGYYFGRPQAL